MCEDLTEVEVNSGELFHGWQTKPVVSKIAEFLRRKDHTSEQDTHQLECHSQEYKIMSAFIADMLDNLPFNNEVGVTKLMRSDAKNVVNEISRVLRDKKSWKEIEWIFDGELEVFKNLVYSVHDLKSAICYNIDLRIYPGIQIQNSVVLDRFSVTRANENLVRVKCDGSFSVNSASMTIWTSSREVVS